MDDFGVLGPLTVTVKGRAVPVAGPRQRRLLAALLMHTGRVVSLDRLVDAVFAGRPSARADATLRSYATRLRQSLAVIGPDVLVREGIGYRLAVPHEHVDAYRFEQQVAHGRRQAGHGDADGAAATVNGALQLWRGEAYEEFSTEMWAQPEANRLEEERRAARELLIDLEMHVGEAGAVAGALRSLLLEDPFREGLVARLMVAQYRDGRPVEALQTYADYRQRSVEELGIDPGPELVDLERRILARDPELDSSGEKTLRGYRLGERMGSGRWGTVYAATLPGSRRDYALRVYATEFADDPRVVRMFESDVRAVAAIDEPALLPLYDAWREPGTAALVMRRMRGGTVQDLLDARTLTPEQARQLLARVAGALLALHRRGRVHGRVKPSSVLLDTSGQAYLAEPALGLPASGDASDAADLVALARTCLLEAYGNARPAPPWLAELVDSADLDLPTTVSRLLHGLRAAPPRPDNPYVGLRAFDRGDADRFFGRDDLVHQVLDRLDAHTTGPRLVLLVGGSGSGKSSVVRAGVLPRLDRGKQRWSTTVMVPGSQPFRNLDDALDRVRTRRRDRPGGVPDSPAALAEAVAALGQDQVLLVIDQLEELFTLASRRDRDRFLDAIATAVSLDGGRLHVVATIRADYFDRPLDHPRFAAIAGRCSLPVPAMTPAELEQTITGPADGRLTIEPGLVSDLVAATVREPAALPALQFTLHELAERGGSVLRRTDLVALGGVDGAIAQRAEELFGTLTSAEQQRIRRVLTRLVVFDSASEPSRRRVPRAVLAAEADDPSAAEALVECWVAARLLAGNRRPDSREPTVELAHEAILTRWPRLRAWIDEDRERLQALARIEDAAEAWRDVDRDPAALLRGARLEQAEELVDQPSRTSPLVGEFVEASATRRADDEQAARDEEARRDRTSHRLRRQRWLLAAALTLALAVGGIALDQRNAATRVAARADERARSATAALAASSAEAARSDWSLGLLLAAEAHRLSPSPTTRRALISAIVAPRPVPTPLYQGDRRYRSVEVDPVTGTIAVRSVDGVVELIDPGSGARVGGVQALGDGGLDVHDGRLVASNRGGDRGSVRAATGGEVKQVVRLPRGVYSTDIEFSPSGDRVAVSDTSGAVTVYDASTWAVADRLTGQDSPVEQVTWSESGDRLYALDSQARFIDWPVPIGQSSTRAKPPDRMDTFNDGDGAWVIDEPLRRETGFGFSELETLPDSPFLIAAPLDGPPWTVDVRGPTRWVPIGARVSRPAQVAVGESPELTFHAAGTSWTISRNYLLPPSPLDGHQKPPPDDVVTQWDAVDIAVSPDGTVITVGSDGNVTRWDVPGSLPGTVPRRQLDLSSHVAFSPDGSVVAHWSPGRTVTLADATSYEESRRLRLGSTDDVHVLGVTFQQSLGRVLVAYCESVPTPYTSCAGRLAAYDAVTGTLASGPVGIGPQRPGAGSPLSSAAEADMLATSDAAGSISLRDPSTLRTSVSLDDLTSELLSPQQVSLQLAADASLLLADAATQPRIAIWDLSTDAPTLAFTSRHLQDAAFAPDGTLLASDVSPRWPEGRVVVLDTDTFSVREHIAMPAGLLQASTTDSGHLMVSSDQSGRVWLWNPSDHRPVTTIRGSAAVLRPDGAGLLLWSNGRAHELPLDDRHLLATACAAAGRNLTEQEWNRHLGAGERYRQTCPDAAEPMAGTAPGSSPRVS